MDLIIDFLKLYQKAINAIYDSLENYSTQASENIVEDREQPFALLWNEDKISSELKQGIFKTIIESTNIKKFRQIIPEFSFLKKILEKKEFIIFGEDNNDDFFAIRIKTQEIVLIESSYKHFIAIAENELAFLKTLTILIELQLLYILNTKPSKVPIEKFRNKCIKTAGGEAYSKYYKFILVPQGDELIEPLWNF